MTIHLNYNFLAAPWNYDDPQVQLDMFDCRNTEWFVDAATMSKNVIIMLDMSGSMLGQRFEIAKQTIEAILETLSDNDFFNIMPVSFIMKISFIGKTYFSFQKSLNYLMSAQMKGYFKLQCAIKSYFGLVY